MLRQLLTASACCLLLAGCAQTVSRDAAAGLTTAQPSEHLAVSPTSAALRTPTVTSAAAASPSGFAGCPSPSPLPSGMSAAVDYVDFVHVNGGDYVGMPDATLTDADRGALQLTVTCSVSTWSDRYGQAVPSEQDGYAAALDAGTPVYAVKGKSPYCQLMAKAGGDWHRYTADLGSDCASSAPYATEMPTTHPAGDPSLADCPKLDAALSGATIVEYLDFVQSGGIAFAADSRLTVEEADKGAPQFRVRCALGHLNDVTHLTPPPARDGDSSYLPAGTEVFAVKGSATRCRLMAQGGKGWTAYTPRPTPSGCPAIPGT